MFSWKDVLIQQERYADSRREGELEQLAQKAQAQQGGSSTIYNRIFHRLQSLFASLRSAPAVPPAETGTNTRPTQIEPLG